MDDLVRAADRVDVAGARDALDFRFDRMGHALQFVGALVAGFAPKRHGNDRYIVDTHRLDQRLQDATPGGLPVLV